MQIQIAKHKKIFYSDGNRLVPTYGWTHTHRDAWILGINNRSIQDGICAIFEQRRVFKSIYTEIATIYYSQQRGPLRFTSNERNWSTGDTTSTYVNFSHCLVKVRQCDVDT